MCEYVDRYIQRTEADIQCLSSSLCFSFVFCIVFDFYEAGALTESAAHWVSLDWQPSKNQGILLPASIFPVLGLLSHTVFMWVLGIQNQVLKLVWLSLEQVGYLPALHQSQFRCFWRKKVLSCKPLGSLEIVNNPHFHRIPNDHCYSDVQNHRPLVCSTGL